VLKCLIKVTEEPQNAENSRAAGRVPACRPPPFSDSPLFTLPRRHALLARQLGARQLLSPFIRPIGRRRHAGYK